MERAELLDRLADALVTRDPGHPLRVGIDGVCGAGKTTIAAALAERLAGHGRPVIQLDSDGFHNVREIRRRHGIDSARGYYEDAYDFDRLRDLTLMPLGPGGSRRYAYSLMNLETDAVEHRFTDAAPDAIVVFDATFIQRGDLREQWDEVIYLDTPRARALERGVQRDQDGLGGEDATRRLFDIRYMAACDIYLAEQSPGERASIVIDNDDPAQPKLVRGLHVSRVS